MPRPNRRNDRLRVLVLVHAEAVPPPNAHRLPASLTWDYAMELAVVRTLRSLGHDVHVLGVADDVRPILDAIASFRPHVAFQGLSFFHDVTAYEAHVVALLELCKLPYTGCNPRGIVLASDKALCKRVLASHGIPTPPFALFAVGQRAHRLPVPLQFPVIVKANGEHGSAGLAQASVVTTDRQLAARAALLRATLGGDVLVEQFLPGREFSVGVLGNDRLTILPVWETWFARLPAGHRAIATERTKWDRAFQRRIGLRTGPARKLSPALARDLRTLAARTFRALGLSGYARIDLRLDGHGRPFVLEANVNSDLSPGEDFPAAARASGLDYRRLVARIVALGQAWRAPWRR